MAPTEGRVARHQRLWGCRRGTPITWQTLTAPNTMTTWKSKASSHKLTANTKAAICCTLQSAICIAEKFPFSTIIHRPQHSRPRVQSTRQDHMQWCIHRPQHSRPRVQSTRQDHMQWCIDYLDSTLSKTLRMHDRQIHGAVVQSALSATDTYVHDQVIHTYQLVNLTYKF